MALLIIAWKNLLRNKQRSVATIFSIVIGMSMMIFINGFNAGLAEQWGNFIINENEGHIRVQHKEFYKYGISEKEKIYMSDTVPLIDILKQNPHVKAILPRVTFGGLIGKGDHSTTCYGYAQDLSSIETVLPEHGKKIVIGKPLSQEDPNGVVIGRALAKSIGATIGDELVLISNTVFGDQRAVLFTVRGLIEMRDDPKAEQSVVLCGLSDDLREFLFEIGPGATELVLRLDQTNNVDQVTEWINKTFASQEAPWIARAWHEDEGFGFLTAIFKGIGVVIMFIFSLLVSVVISNSLMMSVFERLPEIGTMRAVGMEPSQVYKLFYWESIIITFLGSLAGMMVGSILILISNYTGITLSEGLFTGVRPIIELSNLLFSMVVPTIGILIAVWFPIRSSCRMSVVEALNYE